MTTRQIEIDLRKILGATYGGPSLSIDTETKEFVIYVWTDAPVDICTEARGRTLAECIENYNRGQEERARQQNRRRY